MWGFSKSWVRWAYMRPDQGYVPYVLLLREKKHQRAAEVANGAWERWCSDACSCESATSESTLASPRTRLESPHVARNGNISKRLRFKIEQ